MAIISWYSLSWCLLPIACVSIIYMRWVGKPTEVLLASSRMLIQLVSVGYVLVFLFDNPSPWTSLGIFTVMISAASWIAIRPVREHQGYLRCALIALVTAVSIHLFLSIKLVMGIEPWYLPSTFIPLAGMYFANSMNAISLASERYQSALDHGEAAQDARLQAFRAAMIPQINGLLAVGLVALPGMMTGQILSGVSPLIAVRYQIMIMAMILGCSGLGAATMLALLKRRQGKTASQ